MSKLLKTGIVIILISIIVMIGISIWIGFPCEGYNRVPITTIGYTLSALGIIAGLICILVASDKDC